MKLVPTMLPKLPMLPPHQAVVPLQPARLPLVLPVVQVGLLRKLLDLALLVWLWELLVLLFCKGVTGVQHGHLPSSVERIAACKQKEVLHTKLEAIMLK